MNQLKAEHGAKLIYEAPGTAMDWAFSEGVEFATTVELRPGISSWNHAPEEPVALTSKLG